MSVPIKCQFFDGHETCGLPLEYRSTGLVCPTGHGKLIQCTRKDWQKAVKREAFGAWLATLPEATQLSSIGGFTIDGKIGVWFKICRAVLGDPAEYQDQLLARDGGAGYYFHRDDCREDDIEAAGFVLARVCRWEFANGRFATECGKHGVMIESDGCDDSVDYCPFCGGKIE